MDPIAAIEIEDLSRRFGARVGLEGVSLEAPSGARVGVAGGQGAGKSTLAETLAGLQPPSAGQARVAGLPVEAPRARMEIGYVPEEPGLDPERTPLELMRFAGSFFELSDSEVERRADRLLTEVRLEHVREHRIEHLEAGLRRRLALAFALLHDPGLVVLDEPFAGLEGLARARLDRALDRVLDERTLVLLTQDPDVVEARCHRVVGLENGRIAVDAHVEELTEQGAIPYEIQLDPEDRTRAWDRLREHEDVGAVRHDEDAGPSGLEVWVRDRQAAGGVLADLVEAGVEVQAFGPAGSVLATVLADRMEGIA